MDAKTKEHVSGLYGFFQVKKNNGALVIAIKEKTLDHKFSLFELKNPRCANFTCAIFSGIQTILLNVSRTRNEKNAYIVIFIN